MRTQDVQKFLTLNTGPGTTATDEAALEEGMSLSQAYAERENGPPTIRHSRTALKITKAHLERQKMNEDQGYPSNLDDATKVKDMEVQMVQMREALKLLQDPTTTRPPTPAVELGPPPGPPLVPTCQGPKVVTTADGKKVVQRAPVQNPMGLDAAAASEQLLESSVEPLIEPPDNIAEDGVNEGLWAEQPDQPEYEVELPEVDPRAEKVQILVGKVFEFLGSHNPHRAFRRHMAGIHRHVGYSSWPPAAQKEFDVLFQQYLNDTQFVANLCGKVIDMENGYILGPEVVSTLIIAAAGMTAFAVQGL